MLAQTYIYHEPEDISAQLAELGITLEDVYAAIYYGYQHAAQCNEHDFIAAHGWIMWDKTLRGLRERLAEKREGWRSVNNQLPVAENVKTGISIAVTSGDKYTGIRGKRHPRANNPKGAATLRAINANMAVQVPMPFLGLEAEYEAKLQQREAMKTDLGETQAKTTTTWWLLLHPSNNGVRAELSLPVDHLNSNMSQWSRRIIIGLVDFSAADALDNLPSFDSGPEFDVEVKPRLG